MHDNFQILQDRKKYNNTIHLLGMSNADVLDDILHLTDKDYWLEPEEDDNPNFNQDLVWQCKKFLHNNMIYIKLKIVKQNNNLLLVMSYHIDGE